MKAKADDHMPDTAQSGLVPLKSWFSLDIAARIDQGEVEDEIEADVSSEPQPRAIVPARLPRLWSSPRIVGNPMSSADSNAELPHKASTPPAQAGPDQLRCGSLPKPTVCGISSFARLLSVSVLLPI